MRRIRAGDARRTRLFLWLAGSILAVGCGSEPHDPSCCIDLLDRLSEAEIQPLGRPSDAVEAIEIEVNGQATRALAASVPTRVTFLTRLPPRAGFTSWLGIRAEGSVPTDTSGVVFRFGIADHRVYEPLLVRTIRAPEAGTWTPVHVDLSSYGGWQWSLFYRPSEITWRLVLNTYPLGPGSENLRGIWRAPRIEPRH